MRLRAPQPDCLKTDLQRCQWNDPHGLRASPLRLDAQQDVLDERLKVRVPVSYTHLTLPTIYSV